ncbi:MAG TPA: heme-binding domain-containing protein [Chloroflexota bacterium]|nr:heme-binding domain-containing protein [Chloroflexota bacterium]
MSRTLRHRFTLLALLVGAFLLAIQLVPYGRAHASPPVRAEPPWPGQTRDLAARACFDCHSNQTQWPWYASVAPVSWLVQRDVDEGRGKLNFSEWDRQQEVEEAAEQIQEGEMPPWYYVVLHPEARLSRAEQSTLIAGLTQLGGGRDRGDRRR